MREIICRVDIDEATPRDVQFGGIAGEHNVTKLTVTLENRLRLRLLENGVYYYRFDAVDSSGAHFIGEAKILKSDTVTYYVPQSVTAAGGKAEIRVIFSQIVEGQSEKILYSFPFKLRFEDSFHGDVAEVKAVEDVSAIIKQAEDLANRITTSAGVAKGTIRYDIEQVLTEDEQLMALYNIGAVPNLCVKEDYNDAMNWEVLNYEALGNYTLDNFLTYLESPYLAEEKKYMGRKNIDVDGGKWEKLHTFTGDGTTPIWEFSEYSNGAAIKLDAVAVRVINNAPSNGSASMRLYSYYRGASVARVFLANALNTNTRTYATGLIFPFMGIYAPIGTSGSAYSGNVTWAQDQGFDLSKNTEAFPYIDKVKIDIQSDTIRIPNTTTVEIWGVKHYE